MNTRRSFLIIVPAFFILAAFIAATGCITPSAQPGIENMTEPVSPLPTTPVHAPALSLKGVTWELVSYDSGRFAQESVVPGTTISARFETGGIVHGSSGCNQYCARYESTDTRLLIAAPQYTRESCHTPAGVESQEKIYLIDLEKVRTFTIDGDILKLMDEPGKVTLLFRKGQAPPDATQISWKTWHLVSYRDDSGSILQPPGDMVMTARFLDGTISGFAGCNCYQGPYREDGGAMTIGEPVVTDMNCRNATVKGVEEAFFKNLQHVAAYVGTTENCTLVDGRGESLLVFQSPPYGE